MKRIPINEDVFNDLSQEEAAYWLGMLFADGNFFELPSGSTPIVSLGLLEKEHLEKYKKFLGSQVNTRKVKVTKMPNYDFFCVTFTNQAVANVLHSYGMVPKKSLILKPPVCSNLNFRHFLRGFFDGDGCVSVRHGKHMNALRVHLCSTFEFLSWIKDTLHQNNIETTRIIKFASIFQLAINKFKDVEKFKSFIYDGATIYLERKYNLFSTDTATKTGRTSKYKNVSFRKTKDYEKAPWRATYREGHKRKDRYFTSETAAHDFLVSINQTGRYCHELALKTAS